MSQRKKRLDRLIQHRERELEQRMAALSESRNVELRAGERLELEKREVARATEARARAVSGTLAVKSFVEANDFLVSCTRRLELAEVDLVRARRGVVKAQAEVLAAKNELKKIQLLSERVLSEEQKRAERVEQRLSDEISARKSAQAQKRRSQP